MTFHATTPELVPVLSRGKHRNARRGACFMEMASVLAGERWSDHPSGTHPLLAGLARLVNDTVSDPWRPKLIPLIPSVIGLTSDDLHIDAEIALRSALVALPIASAPRQHVLATAVLACERVFAGLDDRPPDSLSPRSRKILDEVPDAASWAQSFSGGAPVSPRTFRVRTAPHILNVSIEGISLSCSPGVEQRLVDLLADTITACRSMILTEAATVQSLAKSPF